MEPSGLSELRTQSWSPGKPWWIEIARQSTREKRAGERERERKRDGRERERVGERES